MQLVSGCPSRRSRSPPREAAGEAGCRRTHRGCGCRRRIAGGSGPAPASSSPSIAMSHADVARVGRRSRARPVIPAYFLRSARNFLTAWSFVSSTGLYVVNMTSLGVDECRRRAGRAGPGCSRWRGRWPSSSRRSAAGACTMAKFVSLSSGRYSPSAPEFLIPSTIGPTSLVPNSSVVFRYTPSRPNAGAAYFWMASADAVHDGDDAVADRRHLRGAELLRRPWWGCRSVRPIHGVPRCRAPR